MLHTRLWKNAVEVVIRAREPLCPNMHCESSSSCLSFHSKKTRSSSNSSLRENAEPTQNSVIHWSDDWVGGDFHLFLMALTNSFKLWVVRLVQCIAVALFLNHHGVAAELHFSVHRAQNTAKEEHGLIERLVITWPYSDEWALQVIRISISVCKNRKARKRRKIFF